ncbi:host cell division inhibitor Icd-like protein [Avibacterium paragallinarum]|uniref:Host cell division inhibitor Icd-like protein n=1 Tax=Avibacterium paragallinarum TaxID=728 RepID=A0ABU7QHK6_AVIPA
MANSSTPSNACFFVRTFCTPKENRLAVIHSMMACSGQPLGWLDFQFYPVSHPATRYRQTVRSLAIALDYLELELIAMLYKFLLLGKHRLNPITINFIHHNTKMNENNSQLTPFTKCGDFFSIFTAIANSVAEPGNSNDKLVADKCTPLNACFFMRSTNTPQERPERLSMVTCYGKGFALCCVPQVAVFQPVTRYRQSLETFAVTSRKLFTCGVNAMKIFIFAAIRRTDLTNQIQKIRIFAESEKQARATLAREFILVLAGRINLKNLSQTHRTLYLIKNAVGGSIEGTTTYNGNRTRKTCGFFTPQIHIQGRLTLSDKAEFVARSIHRTKAEFIRTNKVSRLYAVVEALPHLLQVGKSFTKTYKRLPTMKTITKPTALIAGTFPIAFTSAMAEVNNG